MAKKVKTKEREVSSDLYDLQAVIDTSEKRSRVSSLGVTTRVGKDHCLSTGSLAVDLTFGGGLHPGRWFTFAGRESSGKSTLLYSAIGQAIARNIPVILEDFEGSVEPAYFSRIVQQPIDEVFGKKNEKTGEWIIPPKVRYYKPRHGEEGLLLIQLIMKSMPEKVFKFGRWWNQFKPTKENLELLKGRYDKRRRSETGLLYVPIEDDYSGPELLVCIDSYPSMTPKTLVEKDDQSLALQARMFSKYVANIHNLASMVGAAVVGVNQLRERPGQMFGDPNYEPGGNALRFHSDCRLRIGSVAVPSGSGRIERVGSYEYIYSKCKTAKNKMFVPFRETMVRFCVGSKDGRLGVDHVYDTETYLKMTGQLKRSGKNFVVTIGKFTEEFDKNSFRKHILTDGKVRRLCEKQMRLGKGLDLYSELITSKDKEL